MTRSSFLRHLTFVMSLALVLTVALLHSVTLPSAAAPPTQASQGYWRYVETINNDKDQAVNPDYKAEYWAPEFGEDSLQGIRGRGDYQTSGSCLWTYEAEGGLDRLVADQVVKVHVDATYRGIAPSLLGNQLSVYACFNEAGVMGSGVQMGARCTELAVIPGPRGSLTRDWTLVIPAGPLFASRRAALEVKCCPNCYQTLSAQRVYEWVEGAPPTPTGTPVKIIDCSQVTVSYSPDPPSKGATLNLDAQVIPGISHAPGSEGRWTLNGEELASGTISEWDGCGGIAEYHYICDGYEHSRSLVIPGENCGSGVGWGGAVGAGLAVAVAAAALILRRRKGKKGKNEQYILHLSSNSVELRAGASSTVTATVYQVTALGGHQVASLAGLRVRPTAGARYLDVQPRTGAGSLIFTVSAAPNCPSGKWPVVVEGQASGTRYTAQVEVRVTAPYQVVIKPKDSNNVVPLPPGSLRVCAQVAAAGDVPADKLVELTKNIHFDHQGDNASLIDRRNEQMSGAWKAVQLVQVPGRKDAPGDPLLVAFVDVEGRRLEARLSLVLEPRYALEFRDKETAELPGRAQNALREVMLPYRPREPSHQENLALQATVYAVALDQARNPPTPDGKMSQDIALDKRGLNSECIELQSFAFRAVPAKEGALLWRGLADGVAMKADDPQVVATLAEGAKTIECSLQINLDDCRLGVLKDDLQKIAVWLQGQGFYVRNPLLGAPGMDHIIRIAGIAWDYSSIAWLARKKMAHHGVTCGDYVRMTQDRVLEAVRRVYGGRASLSTEKIQEKSSLEWSSLSDVPDSLLYTIDHLLFKLTTPEDRVFSIDFWDYFRQGAGAAPILVDWAVTEARWVKFMGADVDRANPFRREMPIQEGSDPARAQKLAREGKK